MKLDRDNLRKLILKEMQTLNEGMHDSPPSRSYTHEEVDAYSDYKEQTGLIIEYLSQAIDAADVFDGHLEIRDAIQACLDKVEDMIVV